ncbi:hypothetical protein [Nocardia bhagyanarayanae]|uniref:hypothetical protein n=1 Tax=Nocardia bhagyanarayanae TaxID=1215925 RepID=UPI00163B07A6|nr:hypothetical protein [Nocardia bhagyanarayanae]
MVGETATPAVSNPLWIIALLLGLCELALGGATGMTAGWIQGLFAVFMVVYTTAVTGGFFYMLSTRAQVFYSPANTEAGPRSRNTAARSRAPGLWHRPPTPSWPR